MKTSTLVAVIVAIVVVAGGWYWWSQGNMAAPTDTTPTGQTTTTNNPTGSDYQPGNLLLGVNTDAKLGTYLVASNAMTLYKYTKDTPGVSNCSGDCAVKWPPYIVGSTDALSNIQAGVTGKVGSIARADGKLQVTYNDMPLYFWINDKNVGDTTGQNVGGVWFVVTP
ncbi:MAG: hypothetical protein JWO43_576 [Candidatus Adlerbacteria bacterium]|nr:hypothetical protein [Candidatus Adlerbacteria bacterium]